MSGIIETSGQGATPNNAYLFAGDFSKGTAPTLLDSSEAQKVKRFIENLVFRSIYQIQTGTPDENLLRLNLTDPGKVVWELDIRTALECDPDPTLSADLILLDHGFRVTRPGAVAFHQFGTDGFTVVPQNWPAATSAGYGGALKLAFGSFVAGFKAQSMSGNLIWTLPSGDGSDGQMLMTNGSLGLSWADAEGSGTVTSVATSNGDFVDVSGGTITTTGTITADLSATGTPGETTWLRGDNTWAEIPAGGTVTSVATSDSTFIDLTPDSAITVTGTISAELSATGTADSSTFLRGDNTWAEVSGSGTVTSVDVDGDDTGLVFGGGPITTSGTITMGGILAANYGGTGWDDYTAGDLLYAGTTSTLAKLGIGSQGYVLKVSAAGAPEWDSAGSGTVTEIATSDGTFIDLTPNIPITATGTISADLSATGTADATTFLRGDNTWAEVSGSGTVTEVTAVDGTFIDLATSPALGITATGYVTADLSATGTASSSTYLRGDNSWAEIAAGGTVTSVDVDGDDTGLVFGGGPITTSGTITMGGTLAANYGGTGWDAYAAGDLLYANSTSTLAKLALGDEGYFLKAQGSGVVWAEASGTGTVTSVDVDGDDTGLVFGGGPITTSGTITMGGILAANYGGTGWDDYTAGDLLYADTTSTLAKLNVGVDEQVLTLTSGVPTWADGGMTSFYFSDPYTNSFSVTNGNDVAFTSDDGSVSIDCSTADVIDLAASGIPNIDGGTPDSVYVVNQNANGGSPSSTF